MLYGVSCTVAILDGVSGTVAMLYGVSGTVAMLDGVSKAVEERVKMQQQFSCLYRNNRKLEVLIGK